MHTKTHFEIGDQVKLAVFNDLELGDCSLKARLLGITEDTVLTVDSVDQYHEDQYLTFQEPYRAFGKMFAVRFVKVE